MAEYNIFEIIRSEKKNLNSVSPQQVSKVFAKYDRFESKVFRFRISIRKPSN